MRSKLALVVGVVVIGVMAVALPAWAHHAHGNYAEAMTDFEGVITELHALNPHSWVYVKRTIAPGQEQLWALEGGGARVFRGAEGAVGIKVGDTIKVRCHELRDGTPGCLLGYVKHPDGKVYDYDAFQDKAVVIPGF